MMENGMVISAAESNYGYGWDDPWAWAYPDGQPRGYEDDEEWDDEDEDEYEEEYWA